jgi:hypothetical protein
LTGGGETKRKKEEEANREQKECCQTCPKNTKFMRYEPCPSPPVLKAFKSKGRWIHGLGTLLQLLWKELN